MRSRSPKFFKVDWIPEAAGRKLVQTFAMIVYAYRDQAGKRLDNLTMVYSPDGARVQITLYVDAALDLDQDERQAAEQDPPALHPPPEPWRKKD
jgi:hypothetical protein